MRVDLCYQGSMEGVCPFSRGVLQKACGVLEKTTNACLGQVHWEQIQKKPSCQQAHTFTHHSHIDRLLYMCIYVILLPKVIQFWCVNFLHLLSSISRQSCSVSFIMLECCDEEMTCDMCIIKLPSDHISRGKVIQPLNLQYCLCCFLEEQRDQMGRKCFKGAYGIDDVHV